MAVSAAELEAQRDRLLRARGNPLLRTEVDGKVFQYRSVDEIDAQLRAVDAALAGASTGRRRTRRIIVAGSKGIL